MGDGIVKKHAIIINGDGEERHVWNALRASEELKEEGYSINLMNVEGAQVPEYANYVTPTKENLQKLADSVKSDDDDIVLIYTTGHGSEDTKAIPLGTDHADNKYLHAIFSKITSGQKIVIMDQCYSGDSASLWSGSDAFFVSPDWKESSTACGLFAPNLWAKRSDIIDNGGDANGDGKISFRERFAYASKVYEQNILGAQSLFIPPSSIGDINVDGSKVAKPFPAEAITATDDTEFLAALAKLKPGQLAVVDFSTTWCPACVEYAPEFESLAENSNGQYLFIHVVSKNGDWMDKYKVNAVPSVFIFDHKGKFREVDNRSNPLKDISTAILSDDVMYQWAVSELKAGNKAGYHALAAVAKSNPDLFDLESAKLFEGSIEMGEEHIIKGYLTLIENRPELISPDSKWSVKEIEKLLAKIQWSNVSYYEATVEYQKGNIIETKKLMHEALEIYPNNIAATTSLILLDFEDGDYDAAIAGAIEGLDKFPQDALFFNVIGASNARQLDFSTAVKYYDKALELEPGNQMFRMNRSTVRFVPRNVSLQSMSVRSIVGQKDVMDVAQLLRAEWSAYSIADGISVGPYLQTGFSFGTSRGKQIPLTGGVSLEVSKGLVNASISAGSGYNFDISKGALKPVVSNGGVFEYQASFSVSLPSTNNMLYFGASFGFIHELSNFSHTAFVVNPILVGLKFFR